VTPRRGTPLDAPDVIAKRLGELAGRFVAGCTVTASAVGPAMSAAHQALRDRGDDVGEATRNVMTHVANDSLDLLYELTHGRGRPAMKAARSLYEHQIAAELVTDPGLARRYLDHDPVGRRYFAALDRPERFLRGKALKAYRFRRAKVERDARVAAEAAVASYGPGFRRGWTPLSLRDHAQALGRDGDYPFYKSASLPTHGAAAGLYGTRMDIGEAVVHRTGPALAVCSLAAVYGISFVDISLGLADAVVGRGALDEWRGANLRLLDEIPHYIDAVEELDAELWPSDAPVNVAPMVVVDSYAHADLWLAMPDSGLAFPYDGDYLLTQPQTDVYERLVDEILPKLRVDRLGLMLINAGDINFTRARLQDGRPLGDVVKQGIIGIDSDGVVLAEKGIPAEPFLDDLLGRP